MKLYSNEVVFRGHPDKVCDQISGAILKECLIQDPETRAGIEVTGGKGRIFITGEVTTRAVIRVEEIVRRVLADIGYSTDYEIIDNLGRQSADIALGVDRGGAGDQGMMFGYACNDTEELLPTAMVILQKLSKAYDQLRKDEPTVFYADGKAQITGYYDECFRLKKIKDFTISYQNCETCREQSDAKLVDTANAICAQYGMEVENYHINPTGKFLVGGFDGDAGLTGRKIVVDAYQSFANVGGGCMNGKDPSKVDFSAAHKARQLAKRLVMEKGLRFCQIQLSYSIGMELPMAIYIDSDQGSIEPTKEMYEECKPYNMINDLKLRELDFEQLAAFGHFTD